MSNGPSRGTVRSDRFADRLGRGFLAVFVASVFVLCSMLVINGPRLSAALDAKRASATEAEDRAFCIKFGAGPESGRYPECVSGLNAIRASHLQRSADLFF